MNQKVTLLAGVLLGAFLIQPADGQLFGRRLQQRQVLPQPLRQVPQPQRQVLPQQRQVLPQQRVLRPQVQPQVPQVRLMPRVVQPQVYPTQAVQLRQTVRQPVQRIQQPIQRIQQPVPIVRQPVQVQQRQQIQQIAVPQVQPQQNLVRYQIQTVAVRQPNCVRYYQYRVPVYQQLVQPQAPTTIASRIPTATGQIVGSVEGLQTAATSEVNLPSEQVSVLQKNDEGKPEAVVAAKPLEIDEIIEEPSDPILTDVPLPLTLDENIAVDSPVESSEPLTIDDSIVVEPPAESSEPLTIDEPLDVFDDIQVLEEEPMVEPTTPDFRLEESDIPDDIFSEAAPTFPSVENDPFD